MEISEIVLNQRKYFKSGATLSYKARIAALDKTIGLVQSHESEICAALMLDLGKSEFECIMSETSMVLSEAAFLRRNLRKWIRPRRVATPIAQFYGSSCAVARPYGVALIMAPWNYPFQLCLEPLLGAIAAGNCAVIKPSNYAPHTARLIAKLISENFAPEFICVVLGGREENTLLLEQNFDKIFFTGGTNVGKLVLEKAAANLTSVTLELGGKSPCIVCADADIHMAARRIAFGKFLNAGQTCVAPDYVLAHKSIAKKLTDEISHCIKSFFGENPLKCADYTKIINEKHFDRLCGLISGEAIAFGGSFDKSTLKIAPTLLQQVTLNSPVMQEEIFGPILPILEFEHLSEVVEIVELHQNPLALYLFTSSRKNERFILDNLQFGGGCINDTIVHLASSRMGFGGVGASGMGNYHGKASFDCFSHWRSICKKSTKIDLPIRYHPYSALKLRLLRIFLK